MRVGPLRSSLLAVLVAVCGGYLGDADESDVADEDEANEAPLQCVEGTCRP